MTRPKTRVCLEGGPFNGRVFDADVDQGVVYIAEAEKPPIGEFRSSIMEAQHSTVHRYIPTESGGSLCVYDGIESRQA